MAFNKAQTSTLTKVVIAGFGIVLIIGLAGPSMSALFGAIGGQDGGQTDTSPQGVLDSIAAQHQPTISAYESLLASDPASVTILVGMGNAYFDWAAQIQGTVGTPVGSDKPYWAFTTTFYERAVEAGEDAATVKTDLAVSHFYSGDTASAILWVEAVLEATPDFPTALYNAGIFYENAGRYEDALASFSQYLDADPQGVAGDPEVARERVAGLEATLGE